MQKGGEQVGDKGLIFPIITANFAFIWQKACSGFFEKWQRLALKIRVKKHHSIGIANEHTEKKVCWSL